MSQSATTTKRNLTTIFSLLQPHSPPQPHPKIHLHHHHPPFTITLTTTTSYQNSSSPPPPTTLAMTLTSTNTLPHNYTHPHQYLPLLSHSSFKTTPQKSPSRPHHLRPYFFRALGGMGHPTRARGGGRHLLLQVPWLHSRRRSQG